MRRAARAFAAATIAALVGPRAAGFAPPPGELFVNVKTDCGAKGDGVTDDTAALKAAFGAGKSAPHPKLGVARQIYLPDGVYLVSDRLPVGDKKKFIIGQSRRGVVIRLRDGCPGFQDPKRPRAVVDFGEGSYKGWHFANNFNQRLVNLTVDTGRANPGATGVLYHTNNLGGMYHVTIRSSDPERRGARGLHLGCGTGPGLVWDVAVEGFDVGCLIDSNLHGMTVGRLALSGQRECGFRADGNFSAVWGLVSRNRVPAVVVKDGHFVLLDAECIGGSPTEAAVLVKGGVVFCRNVKTSGYGKALVSEGPERAELAPPRVSEFVRPRGFSLFGSEPRSLGLPVEEPPISMDWGDPAQWVVIGPGEGSSGRIQRAIDDGAETIFLAGFHEIAETIHIRNKLKRITAGGGTFRSSGFKGGTKPLWRLEDGVPSTVFIEFLCDEYGDVAWGIEHASKRTLVCRSAGVHTYRNTVTGGKAFFLDSGPGPGSVIKGPQQVWAWQTNTESYDHNPHILNDGGMLFVCGDKIEKDRTSIGTIGGGWTEVLGGLLYKNKQRVGMAPAFFNTDSNVCISIGHYGQRYDSLIEEKRGGETRNLTPEMLGGHWVPLYSGWQKSFPGSRLP